MLVRRSDKRVPGFRHTKKTRGQQTEACSLQVTPTGSTKTESLHSSRADSRVSRSHAAFPDKKPVVKTAQLNATEPERIHPREENKTASIPKPLVRSIGQGEAQLALGGGGFSTVVEPRRAAQEESAGLRRRREVLLQ